MLQQASDLATGSVRAGDLVFRYGGEDRTANITVSIGVATYNGHPDYWTMLKDADGTLLHKPAIRIMGSQ